MVVQPAIEVKSVVDTSASQADRGRPDSSEQSPANAQVARGLLGGEAARLHPTVGPIRVVLVHFLLCLHGEHSRMTNSEFA